jgi:hypothetical protein
VAGHCPGHHASKQKKLKREWSDLTSSRCKNSLMQSAIHAFRLFSLKRSRSRLLWCHLESEATVAMSGQVRTHDEIASLRSQ